jgi:hypothetical protein
MGIPAERSWLFWDVDPDAIRAAEGNDARAVARDHQKTKHRNCG